MTHGARYEGYLSTPVHSTVARERSYSSRLDDRYRQQAPGQGGRGRGGGWEGAGREQSLESPYYNKHKGKSIRLAGAVVESSSDGGDIVWSASSHGMGGGGGGGAAASIHLAGAVTESSTDGGGGGGAADGAGFDGFGAEYLVSSSDDDDSYDQEYGDPNDADYKKRLGETHEAPSEVYMSFDSFTKGDDAASMYADIGGAGFNVVSEGVNSIPRRPEEQLCLAVEGTKWLVVSSDLKDSIKTFLFKVMHSVTFERNRLTFTYIDEDKESKLYVH